MKHPALAVTAAALLTLVLAPFAASSASAAGSDSPVPYTVSADGLTLPAGDTFPDGGHVNIRYTDGTGAGRSASVHFESQNAQPSGVFIGTSYLPWSYLIPASPYCITWVQVSLYNEHFGEGGQSPVCSGTPTPPVTPPAHTVTTGTASFESLTCTVGSRNQVTLPAVDGGVWATSGAGASTSLPIATGYAGVPSGAGPFTFTLSDGDATDLFDVTPWSGDWTPTDASTLACAVTPPVTPPTSTPTPTPTPTPMPTSTPSSTPSPEASVASGATIAPVRAIVGSTPATATERTSHSEAPSTAVLASTGFGDDLPILAAIVGGTLLAGAIMLGIGAIARRHGRNGGDDGNRTRVISLEG
jgi:hypothetical protein